MTSSMPRGTEYTLTIGTGAKSADSGALPLQAPFQAKFQIQAPDKTRPALASFAPANGAMGHSMTGTVTLTFSEPMDCASFESAFTWLSPQSAVRTWSRCSGPVVELTRSERFKHGETVSWQLARTAKDVAGNRLEKGASGTFRVARVATAVLHSVSSLDGYVGSYGTQTSSGGTMKVGARGANNEELRGLVTFSLSALPSDTVGIYAASLTVSQTAVKGDPYGKFRGLYAESVDYGGTLESSDFSVLPDEDVECGLFFFFCHDVPSSVYFGDSRRIGPMTEYVSAKVARDFERRSVRGNRVQFRFRFGQLVKPDGTSNATGGEDVIELNTAEASFGAPVLEVTYEYP